MSDVVGLIRAHIRDMEPYKPVYPFEVVARRLGKDLQEIVKLDANENPYGAHPAVQEALRDLQYAHVYPDPECRLLREALAQQLGVPMVNLMAGAGADELIDMIMRLFLDPGDVLLNCTPTFGMYAFDAGVNGARLVQVPRKADFSLDLPGIERAAAKHEAKLLFLASPNNPDGGVLPDETLDRILDLPLVVVVRAFRRARFQPLASGVGSPESDRAADVQQMGRSGRAAGGLWGFPRSIDAVLVEDQTAL